MRIGMEKAVAQNLLRENLDELLRDLMLVDARRFELQVINGASATRDLLIPNADEQAREQGLPAPDGEDSEKAEESETNEPA